MNLLKSDRPARGAADCAAPRVESDEDLRDRLRLDFLHAHVELDGEVLEERVATTRERLELLSGLGELLRLVLLRVDRLENVDDHAGVARGVAHATAKHELRVVDVIDGVEVDGEADAEPLQRVVDRVEDVTDEIDDLLNPLGVLDAGDRVEVRAVLPQIQEDVRPEGVDRSVEQPAHELSVVLCRHFFVPTT